MRILLTGANSFIGSHLTRYFLDAGHSVVATFRKTNDAVHSLSEHPARPLLVMLDLTDRENFGELPTRIDAIVHVAGVSLTQGIAVDEMLACNVLGTQNLIRYAKSACAGMLIYASSLSVHGHVEENVVDEATPVRDPSIYGGSKFLAERQIEAESDCFPAFAIRLPGVLGTGAPNRAWIPSLTARLRCHEDVTIYNPAAAFNNAAHVCDLCSFCLHLLESEAEGFMAFPVGAGGTITIAEAVDVLASTIGSRSRVLIDQSRSAGFTISSTQAYSLGYRPMGVEDMLRRFAVESSRSRL